MAKDLHDTVDFAPAWLNFNNSNKKKSDKKLHEVRSTSSSTLSHNSLSKSSKDSSHHSTGVKFNGGFSKSSSRHQYLPLTKTIGSPQSADFLSTFGGSRRNNEYLQSVADHGKGFSRTAWEAPAHMSHPNGLLRRSTSVLTKFGNNGTGMDSEFPSLSDKDPYKRRNWQPVKQSSPSGNVVNMWHKPLILKDRDSEMNANLPDQSSNSSSSKIYKSLVPKTGHQKQPYRRTLSIPLALDLPSDRRSGQRKDLSFDENRGKMLTGNTSSLRLAKSELQTSITPESTKQDKSEWNENVDSPHGKCMDSSVDSRSNDIDYFDKMHGYNRTLEEDRMQPDDSMLSRSLEAEHRLLQQMGWKNPEEPPLTEEEIREFQIRCSSANPPAPAAQLKKELKIALTKWKFAGIRRDIKTNGNMDTLDLQQNSSSDEWEDDLSDDEDF